jgi:hypothetical protein
MHRRKGDFCLSLLFSLFSGKNERFSAVRIFCRDGEIFLIALSNSALLERHRGGRP